MDKYLHLDLYPDALLALEAMAEKKLAILSNGSPDMLNALVRNSGLRPVLDATISVDANRIFKPSPEAYTLIESTLKIAPARSLVHLLQSLGRLRRKIVRAQRRLDRAGDAGGDGAGVPGKRHAAAAHHVQGDPHPDGRARLQPDYRIHALAELPRWFPRGP